MRFFLVSAFLATLFSASFSAPLQIGKIYGHEDFNRDPQNPTNPPLPLTDHNPAHLASIQMATDTAHEQIMNMKNMLDNNHPDLDQHLANAFGPNANKAEIKRVVDRLATGVIDVGRTNIPNTDEHAGVAAVAHSNQYDARMKVTQAFHGMSPGAQAGALIHEASHMLGNTKDYFHTDPNDPNHKYAPIATADGKQNGDPSGYAHTSLDHLKQHASEVMHKNADSYRVFGHTATHGLNKPLPEISVTRPAPNCQSAGKKGCPIQ